MTSYDIEDAITGVANFLLTWIVPLAMWLVAGFLGLKFVLDPWLTKIWIATEDNGLIGQIVFLGSSAGLFFVMQVVLFAAVVLIWWPVRLKRELDPWG